MIQCYLKYACRWDPILNLQVSVLLQNTNATANNPQSVCPFCICTWDNWNFIKELNTLLIMCLVKPSSYISIYSLYQNLILIFILACKVWARIICQQKNWQNQSLNNQVLRNTHRYTTKIHMNICKFIISECCEYMGYLWNRKFSFVFIDKMSHTWVLQWWSGKLLC